MYGDEDFARLIMNIGLILCIPMAFLLGPVILRAACHLCGVEVPNFVRALWVSLGTWLLIPILGRAIAFLTGHASAFLGKGVITTLALSPPRGLVTGGPFLGNAILFALAMITGADMQFPRPLFTREEIVAPGIEAATSEATLSLTGTFVNLNLIMLVIVAIYNRYLGLMIGHAVAVWIVDLCLKLEILGFLVLFILAVSRFLHGSPV